MEQQELELQAKQQQMDASKELLKIQQERLKLESDVALHKAELALKEEAQTDKVSSDDMKNMIQAVDKIAKING